MQEYKFNTDGPLATVGPYKAKEHSALLLRKLPCFAVFSINAAANKTL